MALLERRVQKRKRSRSESESMDRELEVERSSRRSRRRNKKSKKKRQRKANLHEERARMLEMALVPIGRAGMRAKDKGEKSVTKDIACRRGGVLENRLQLLLFADADGLSVANIYAHALEVGSDSNNERCMWKAVKEANASVKVSRGGGGGFVRAMHRRLDLQRHTFCGC